MNNMFVLGRKGIFKWYRPVLRISSPPSHSWAATHIHYALRVPLYVFFTHTLDLRTDLANCAPSLYEETTREER